MTLSDTLNTLTIDKTSITHSNATTALDIRSNQNIQLTTPNIINLIADPTGLLNPATSGININSYNGLRVYSQSDVAVTTLNGYSIIGNNDNNLPDATTYSLSADEFYIDFINAPAQHTSYSRLTPYSQLEMNDETGGGSNTSRVRLSDIRLDYYTTGTKPAYYQFQYATNNIFRYDLTGIKMGTSGTGVNINFNHIKYPATYNTASATLGTTSNAVQTFNINVAPFTAFLPNASATNVGTQYTITNTNVNSLVVSTTGGTQLIYSSTGAASAVTRSLAQGHSHIFTAILTTGASTFGWSMV